MSFFYFFPAKGNIPVHLLETVVCNRLKYLESVYESRSPLYDEYTIEGSIYDNVGHYILCVLAILDGKSDFTSFLIKAEETLFNHRLKQLSAYDLRCLAKKILQSIKRLNIDLQCIDPLYVLCQHLVIRRLAHHVATVCNNECMLHKIQINFKHCLKLVAKREVEIKNGIASLFCSRWKKYLITIFSELLRHRIYNTQINLIKDDPRIIELYETIKRKFHFNYNQGNKIINVLKSQEVDSHSKFFPPCMINLHQHLRKGHRLSHNQRFYYSLFLKDIGMSMEEAVKFWKSEYSQEPDRTHICCHNWKKDEKKYLYGIRHLYGLEGGRKTYLSKTCQFIQNSDSTYSEGGCPFKSFDKERMQKIMTIQSEDIYERICELKVSKEYTTACIFFLNNNFTLNNMTNCDTSFNFNPVKYYLQASNK